MPKDRKLQTGDYIGFEDLFRGKAGTIKPFGEVVKMQFDAGPDWMTQSWITFPSADILIDDENTLNFECDSMFMEKEEDDDDDTDAI